MFSMAGWLTRGEVVKGNQVAKVLKSSSLTVCVLVMNL